MSNIKISVIIPIYNVEKYLEECIESVINQTYRNLEIILVNDGSTDKSGEICDKYSQKDSRIIVIHKENGGLSDARNAGVAISSGDYGIFLDSDDFWTQKDALNILVQRVLATNADVLNFTYHKLDEETNQISNNFVYKENMPLNICSTIDQIEFLINNYIYIASACNKFIKINLLKNISFEYGKFSEDIEWCAKLLSEGKIFDFINLNFYCYRQRRGSISKSISMKSCNDLKDAILNCVNLTKSSTQEKKEALFKYTAYQFSTFIAVQAYANIFPYECINELNNVKWVLKYYGNNRKVKYMYYGSRVFGLNIWCRIIRFTKSIWDSRRDKK